MCICCALGALCLIKEVCPVHAYFMLLEHVTYTCICYAPGALCLIKEVCPVHASFVL